MVNIQEWIERNKPNMTIWQIIRVLLVILGGFMVHLSLGTIYTFGNMAPYIVSYVRNQSHPEDLRQGTTSWVFALALMGQGSAMFVGGWLVKKIGSRWATLIGGLTMSLGVALSYFTIKVNFWVFLLTYGLLFGIGVGLAYIGPLTCAMRWLPKRKGLANGIVVAGFGLGALIFNFVQTGYINPANKKAVENKNGEKYFEDEDLLHRVPFVFLILAGCYSILQVIGSLLMADPPEGYGTDSSEEAKKPASVVAKSGQYREIDDNSYFVRGQEAKKSGSIINSRRKTASEKANKDGEQKDEEKAKLIRYSSSPASSRESSPPDMESSVASNGSWATSNVVTSLTPLQMLQKLSFYHLWLMFLFGGLATALFATLFKFFGQEVVNNDHFLATVGSVSAIFNFLGRIVWGNIADKISYKFSLVYFSGIMTIMLLTIYICNIGGKFMFLVWVCAIFFCIGGNFSTFPTAVARAYGAQHVSINYGLLFTSQVIAGTIGALLATILTHLIGTTGLFFLVSGMTGVMFVLALVYRPKRYIALRPE